MVLPNGLYVLAIFSNRLRKHGISATLSLIDAKNPIFDALSKMWFRNTKGPAIAGPLG